MSSVALNMQKTANVDVSAQYDVVVLGAGPYGLSAAAHLKAKKLRVAIFGKPLFLWREQMPKGMYLRSYSWASSLSDPAKNYTIERYFAFKGMPAEDPLSIETFIDYGLWFQKNVVPDVDETYISYIERHGCQFIVTLEDGRVLQTSAVVMAPGLHCYVYRAEEYSHLSPELVSHTSDRNDLSIFAGKEVAVIGGGQAATESAAILHESGARVHQLTRRTIKWLQPDEVNLPPLKKLYTNLREPMAGMGNGWTNVILEKSPYLLHYLSRSLRDRVFENLHGPAGSYWLKPRIVGQIDLREEVEVTKVEEVDHKVRLTLSTGETLTVDHVLLGTGFRADVQRLTMLEQSIRDAIAVYKRVPVLQSHFESSVPGLFFVGYTAGRSFGPFYRFVVGTDAAARRVASGVARYVAHR